MAPEGRGEGGGEEREEEHDREDLEHAMQSLTVVAPEPGANGSVERGKGGNGTVEDGNGAEENANRREQARQQKDVVEEEKDEDGFLYITYAGENIFG